MHGGYDSKSSVPDTALRAAELELRGDPQELTTRLFNARDELKALGHDLEVVTCNGDEMEEKLEAIARHRSARLYPDKPFDVDDWEFPTLDPDGEYVIGFNFAPKHMKNVYSEHFAQAGFKVVFVDACHLRKAYKGGVLPLERHTSPTPDCKRLAEPSSSALAHVRSEPAVPRDRDDFHHKHGDCQQEYRPSGLLVQV